MLQGQAHGLLLKHFYSCKQSPERRPFAYIPLKTGSSSAFGQLLRRLCHIFKHKDEMADASAHYKQMENFM